MRLVVQLTFALAVTWPAAAQSSLTPNTLRLDDPHDSRRWGLFLWDHDHRWGEGQPGYEAKALQCRS